MTKIAVYGDSFASQKIGWPNYLRLLYKKNCELDVFGVGGTSANFSYMRFLETHEKYDIVIFLWTSITRNALIVKDLQTTKKYTIHGFTESDIPYDLDLLESTTRENLRENLRYNNIIYPDIPEFVEIDKNWVLHETVYSTKYFSKNFLEHTAMKDSVKLRRPDSINIECFGNINYLGNFNHPDNCGMSNICISELNELIFDEYKRSGIELTSDPTKFDDPKVRPNHLTLKQSEEFAVYLYKHINDKNFDIHKTFKDPQKYYTMSKTPEEAGFFVIPRV